MILPFQSPQNVQRILSGFPTSFVLSTDGRKTIRENDNRKAILLLVNNSHSDAIMLQLVGTDVIEINDGS